MLLLALLLQSVPASPNDTVAIPRLTGDIDVERPSSRRYRLDVERVAEEDEQRAVLRGVWQECGITGAPVCPSKARMVLQASLDRRD